MVKSLVLSFLLVMPAMAMATDVPAANETCFSPQENCDERLIAFMGSATKTLETAVYNLTHRGIAQAFRDAKARGVKVRIVVDKGEAQIDKSLVDDLNKDGFAGQIRFGTARGLMHDKYTVIDGRRVETGSFNYTWAATKYNTENQIYLDVPAVVARYSTQFEDLWTAGVEVPADFVGDKTFGQRD